MYDGVWEFKIESAVAPMRGGGAGDDDFMDCGPSAADNEGAVDGAATDSCWTAAEAACRSGAGVLAGAAAGMVVDIWVEVVSCSADVSVRQSRVGHRSSYDELDEAGVLRYIKNLGEGMGGGNGRAEAATGARFGKRRSPALQDCALPYPLLGLIQLAPRQKPWVKRTYDRFMHENTSGGKYIA